MADSNYHRSVGETNKTHRQAINEFVNPSTQQFILASGIKQGDTVLDLGCGIGIMTAWLAEQVGPEGKVVAVDNCDQQLMIAEQVAKDKNLTNIEFTNISAADISNLNQQFDFVYCRFLLIHLLNPMQVLETIYHSLKKGGVFACESAILGHEYCYPTSDAFSRWRELNHDVLAATNRDPQTGKKLFHYLHQLGFQGIGAKIFQPVLNGSDLKYEMIITDLLEQENALLKTNLITEEELHDLVSELTELVEDESVMMAYTQSLQIAGIK